MAKNENPIVNSPIGTFAFAYLAKPDTEAPKGASFKPDGKYKLTLVIEDGSMLDSLREQAVAHARKEWGDAFSEDDLYLPWGPGDARGDEFVGKYLLTAKTQYQPKGYDAQPKLLPEGVFGRSGDKGRVRFAMQPFKKTEKVKDAKTKRVTDVDLYGITARLFSYQVTEKGVGGGGDGGFDGVDGGYAAEDTSGGFAGRGAPANKAEAPEGDDF